MKNASLSWWSLKVDKHLKVQRLQISLGPRQQVLWDDPIHIKPTEHVYMYILQPENIQELRSAYFSWRGMFI